MICVKSPSTPFLSKALELPLCSDLLPYVTGISNLSPLCCLLLPYVTQISDLLPL
jgi:hypothetical protein